MIGRISSLIPAGVITRSQTAAGSASRRDETDISARLDIRSTSQPSLRTLCGEVQETLATQMASRDAARFVGRTEELARFEGLLEESAPISVILLHGPAGVGKSALLRELARQAEARGIETVTVEARDLAPLAEALDEAIEPALRSARPLLLLDSWERLTALDCPPAPEPAARGCRPRPGS